MSIRYNLAGTARRSLVGAISEILGRPAEYLGTPSFAYAIGNYIVDREGTLYRNPRQPAPTPGGGTSLREETDRLIAALSERGFEEDYSGDPVPGEPDNLVVEIPRIGFGDRALANLEKIVASKKTLIEKALGLDDLPFGGGLPIEADEDTLRFRWWFPLAGEEAEADAYIRLVSAMCEMARRQKRVTAVEKKVENEKFAMRVFLVRLGFIGPEYKAARKFLLRNLSGNSSWKNGRPPARAAESAETQGIEPPDEDAGKPF